MDRFIKTLIHIQLTPSSKANIGSIYVDTYHFNAVSNRIKVLHVWMPIRRF